ncbi:MAG: DUF5060 domain-containing protein [Candidatus Brocadiia bacterium]
MLRLVTYFIFIGMLTAMTDAARPDDWSRTARQWTPVKWEIPNPDWEGNPFDVEASVRFSHDETGERHVTGMFYDGEGTWRFRFTGTRPGRWSFTTESGDADLDGLTGVVTVEPNPDGVGFVTAQGNTWCRQVGVDRRLEAFVPQFVMYDQPAAYHGRADRIDGDIHTFLVEHGFSGFHTYVFCRWFDINEERSSGVDPDDPNPDPRTFEALELLIRKTHATGGVVHIWVWGDESRHQTPVKWGINGPANRRLQRYIAARLGPLPGWTMGYGYDLWEWTDGEQLTAWHEYMSEHLGWPHMLGARSFKHSLDQMSEAMDYASYEQHRPDYAKYVETIERRPEKPAFSEDRFRIRGRPKDYTMEETRRGLWHSTMAGGVANIWGNLENGMRPGGGSRPYPRPEWIKTWSRFLEGRFLLGMERRNDLTDGVCLHWPDGPGLVFYREDATEISLDLSGMDGPLPAIAVDACKPYEELDLGDLPPERQTWEAPYASDWAVAVGRFQ